MNRNRKRKPLEQMDVMDDFMMNELAAHPTEGKKFGRTLLSVLLQRKIGEVTIKVQSILQGDSPEFRGIRLDVEIRERVDKASESSEEAGESASCRIYDVEPQKRKVKNLPKRSRFYQAKLDSKGLESGVDNWNMLPDLYVIMITSYDPFGYDYMMYTIHNKCDELPDMEYNDGLKYIYFYTKGKKGGSKEIKALLNYLQRSIIENVTDEATQSIHNSVEKIRHSAEVRGKYMTVGEIMDYNQLLGQLDVFISILSDLGEVPEELIERAEALDKESLKAWIKLAANVSSVEEFLEKIS